MKKLESQNLTSIKAPIIEALRKYYENPCVQFHIPGHTKGGAILKDFENLIGRKAIFLDSTDEFNNLGTLHPATGAIKEAQEIAAQAFGAAKTFFLVGGSTVGNLAIAMTLSKENDEVIIGRNCHRSIITGIINSGANPLWAVPEKLEDWGVWGSVSSENIKELLEENPSVSLVWITSPTYEGIVSDVEKISQICKKYGVILAVDEAHGCLWNFNEEFPSPAMKAGADIVVQSMHKTGGSLAQSSMLHVAPHSKIDIEKLESNLRLLHTTSPSYTMLASLDAARAFLQSDEGSHKIESAISNAKYIRNRLALQPEVSIISKNHAQIDLTKIFLKIENIGGEHLESILENEYHIEVESAADEGVLILSNIGNNKKEVEYFCECIESIVKSRFSQIKYEQNSKLMPLCMPKMAMNPRKAHSLNQEKVEISESIGRICAEVIAECPPGISVLVPGEIIEEKHLSYLIHYDFISVVKD